MQMPESVDVDSPSQRDAQVGHTPRKYISHLHECHECERMPLLTIPSLDEWIYHHPCPLCFVQDTPSPPQAPLHKPPPPCERRAGSCDVCGKLEGDGGEATSSCVADGCQVGCA
jgi:hypothetical protein